MKWIRFLGVCFLMFESTSALCCGEDVELLVPLAAIEVRFGDPIFVPIAIANYGQQDAVVPSLGGYHPMMDCKAYLNDSTGPIVETTFVSGSMPFESAILKSRNVESTVLALNIWHPTAAREFKDGATVVLELNSLQISAPTVKLNAKFRVYVKGSALKDESVFLETADLLRESIQEGPKTEIGFGANCVHLAIGVDCGNASMFGPLCWDVIEIPRIEQELANSGRFSKSSFYKTKRSKVLPDSALFRCMRCAEIREEIIYGERRSVDQLRVSLAEYRKILLAANPVEYQFHVRALALMSNLGNDREEYYRIIAHEFVDVLAFLDPTRLGGRSTTSRLTESE